MSKSKGKSKKTVRGPQLALERTPRLRYLEPPTKKDGNPFFALRVPRELLAAFRKHAKGKGSTATALVRGYMSKATGVAVEADNDE